jgi:hypothetical protein
VPFTLIGMGIDLGQAMIWPHRVLLGVVTAVVWMLPVDASIVAVGRADSGFPDVQTYPEADWAPYMVSLDFLGYSHGFQFTAPSGYRCRMTTVAKTYPAAFATCWGGLPGTAQNAVYVSDAQAAHYVTRNLAEFDEYSVYSDAVEGSEVKKRFGPDDYKTLPAGSRLDRAGVTCVVDVHMTACITDQGTRSGDRHGFVLAPDGNQLF